MARTAVAIELGWARVQVIQLNKWSLIAVEQKVANDMIRIRPKRANVRDSDAAHFGWGRRSHDIASESIVQRNLHEILTC